MELVKKKLKLLPFFNIFLLFCFCFPFWIRILEGKCMRFRVHSPVEKSRVSLCLASEYLKRWFFRLVSCWGCGGGSESPQGRNDRPPLDTPVCGIFRDPTEICYSVEISMSRHLDSQLWGCVRVWWVHMVIFLYGISLNWRGCVRMLRVLILVPRGISKHCDLETAIGPSPGEIAWKCG